MAHDDGAQIAVKFTSFSLRAIGFNASCRPVNQEHHKESTPLVGNRSLLAGSVIGLRSKTTDRPLATRHGARSPANAPGSTGTIARSPML